MFSASLCAGSTMERSGGIPVSAIDNGLDAGHSCQRRISGRKEQRDEQLKFR
jgi:hypothetical protein